MKTRILLLIAAAAALPSLALADAAAGKARFESTCTDCHEPGDFAGKSAMDLTTSLRGISSGMIKHKGKVKLTDAEIADLVAHLAPAKARSAPATAAATRASSPSTAASSNPSATPATSKGATTKGPNSPPSAAATAAVGGTATSAVASTSNVAGNATVTAQGKALFAKQCAECHEAADFAGQPAADLNERLGAITGGKIKHKPKLALSDAERQSVAAYLSAGR